MRLAGIWHWTKEKIGWGLGRCRLTAAYMETQVSRRLQAWSGDHHIDPKEVPGIFFVNAPLKTDAPNIIDIAPTTLDLFGIKPPG